VKNADGEKSKLFQFKIFIKDGGEVDVKNHFFQFGRSSILFIDYLLVGGSEK
jgi:hypothetical protein